MVKKFISKNEKNIKVKKKFIHRTKTMKFLRSLGRKNKVSNFQDIIGSTEINLKQIINNLISSLDIPFSNKNIKSNEVPIKHELPSNIPDELFENMLIKGINNAKENWNDNNLKFLKKLLLKLLEEDEDNNLSSNNNMHLNFLSSTNNLEKTYKKYLLLSLLKSEENFNYDLSQFDNIYETTPIYILYQCKMNFQNSIEYTDKVQGRLSMQNFESLLYSNTILNCYKEVIYDLYGKFIETSDIEKMIRDFRKNHSIFFIEMEDNLLGLTLYNGTILLNKDFYNNKNNFPKTLIGFLTLFHEYSHIISKLIRGDKNYFYDTGHFLESNNSLVNIDESGDYFENKLIFDVLRNKEITNLESKYLLDAKNYVYENSQEFNQSFEKFRNDNINIILNSRKIFISKNSNNKHIRVNIGCGFGKRKFM